MPFVYHSIPIFRLKEEIARLSAYVAGGKSSSAGNHSTGKEDDILMMKEQVFSLIASVDPQHATSRSDKSDRTYIYH